MASVLRLVIAVCLILPLWAGAAGLEGTLVVANRQESAGSVSFFDLVTGVEVGRVPVGPRVPHEVAVSPDGRLALTSEYGTADNPGSELVVMDVASVTEVGRIDLGPESRPHSMRFLPEGRRAVATMENADRLALVDVQDLSVVRTFATGGREGHMVRLSPDGARAYVTNRGAEGTLSVIFLNEERDPVVVPTGEGAEGIAVTPDGSEIWVANRRADTLSVINSESLEVVATLPLRPYSGRVEIASGGQVLIPNGLQAEPAIQNLRIYDVQTRELIVDLPVRNGRPQRGSFGVLAHGNLAFLSDRFNGDILMYDLAEPAAPRLFTTGHDIPDGMGWSPRRIAAFE